MQSRSLVPWARIKAKVSLEEQKFSSNPWSGHMMEGCGLMIKGVRGDLLLFGMQRLWVDEW